MTPASRPPAPPAGPAPAGEAPRHPPVETLAAHLGGELPEAEADQVREHLTGCGQCIELLLDLAAFERPAGDDEDAGAGGDAGAERAESWRRLLEERPWDEPAAEAGAPATAPPPAAPETAARSAAPPAPASAQPRRPPHRRRERYRGLLGTGLIAASLAAAVLSGLWSLHLAGRLSAPDPDHPIVDLVPGDGVTRGGGSDDGLPVPPRASFTAVILPDVDVDRGFDRYQAEIHDVAGRIIWRGALRPSDPTSPFLTLGLSRRLLSDPRYTLRLWGLDGNRRVEAGVYPIEFAF